MKKIFVDEKGNLSTVDAPPGAIVRVDSPHGETYHREASDEDFEKASRTAKKGQRLSESEVDKVKKTNNA